MKRQLTRRRFGQLAIATTAVAGLGYLSTRVVAQTPSSIYGASNRKDRFVIESLNLANGQIQELATVPKESGEQLKSLNALVDNTFLLTINPLSSGKKENDPPRLVTVGPGQLPISVPVSGLKKQEVIQSVLVTNDGSVIALVTKKDKKLARLVNIDVKAGAISNNDKIKLRDDERFDNLVQLTNGVIYTTTLGLKGETSLAQLDLDKGQLIPKGQLKKIEDNTGWISGFSSLATAPGNQIYALGAPRYVTPLRLYSINVDSETISLIQIWDVVKITTRIS